MRSSGNAFQVVVAWQAKIETRGNLFPLDEHKRQLALRLPRDQRDLTAIGSSLHAAYVVLGQLQTERTQVRILVHLIRLPGQTHLWVTRLDRATTELDPLSIESEAARKVGEEFSQRIVKDSGGSPLPEIPNP